MTDNQQDTLNNIRALAAHEANEIYKQLKKKYPSDASYLSAIMIETIEYVLAYTLIGVERASDAKAIMRLILKETRRKMDMIKERMKEHAKGNAIESAPKVHLPKDMAASAQDIEAGQEYLDRA